MPEINQVIMLRPTESPIVFIQQLGRGVRKTDEKEYVVEGNRVIPGSSTLHFDEVSRKRIFQAIDNANFSDIKLIKSNYATLKNKLGHIPALTDFDKYGEMDVCRIFDNNSLGLTINSL